MISFSSSEEVVFVSRTQDWQEVWLRDCFWHFLFCVILVVIMIIWRPSANRNRFAYSLVNDLDQEEEEQESMENKNFGENPKFLVMIKIEVGCQNFVRILKILGLSECVCVCVCVSVFALSNFALLRPKL